MTPTKTVTPTVTPSVSPTQTPTQTPTPTVTPTASPTTQFVTVGTANTNTLNVNLYDAYVAIYGVPAAAKNVEFTVAGNIGSASTATAALDTGTWPAGSVITLIVPAVSDGSYSPANGIVAGAGGNGGNISSTTLNQGSVFNATNGGAAINLSHDITIVNNGIIGGGGGGGAAARRGPTYVPNDPYSGGGGGGITVGLAGTCSGNNCGGAGVTLGSSGNYITGGTGGSASGGQAGTGGTLGASGYSGSGFVGTSSTPGTAGKCINRNTYVPNMLGTGQYLGDVS